MRRLPEAALALLGLALLACVVLGIVNAVKGEWGNVAGAAILLVSLLAMIYFASRPGPRDPR